MADAERIVDNGRPWIKTNKGANKLYDKYCSADGALAEKIDVGTKKDAIDLHSHRVDVERWSPR